MFDDDRDAVRVRIDEGVEVGLRYLRECAVAKCLVVAERPNEIDKIS
jgi:hypothetical protein